MNGYYRPTDTNPRWYEMWVEYQETDTSEEILDMLCKSACGIEQGAVSDACKSYARHIHAHLIAAYKLGQRSRDN